MTHKHAPSRVAIKTLADGVGDSTRQRASEHPFIGTGSSETLTNQESIGAGLLTDPARPAGFNGESHAAAASS